MALTQSRQKLHNFLGMVTLNWFSRDRKIRNSQSSAQRVLRGLTVSNYLYSSSNAFSSNNDALSIRKGNNHLLYINFAHNMADEFARFRRTFTLLNIWSSNSINQTQDYRNVKFSHFLFPSPLTDPQPLVAKPMHFYHSFSKIPLPLVPFSPVDLHE